MIYTYIYIFSFAPIIFDNINASYISVNALSRHFLSTVVFDIGVSNYCQSRLSSASSSTSDASTKSRLELDLLSISLSSLIEFRSNQFCRKKAVVKIFCCAFSCDSYQFSSSTKIQQSVFKRIANFIVEWILRYLRPQPCSSSARHLDDLS